MWLKCDNCNVEFERKNGNVKPEIKNHFCCRKCFQDFKNKRAFIDVPCGTCGNLITMRRSRYNRADRTSKKFFCSKSCVGKHSHKFAKKSRRSKLELFIEMHLKNEYPNLEVIYNNRTFGIEFDIYIPSLKLAIELNGPLHYHSIYGEKKLLQIKERDTRKNLICLEQNIGLWTLNISSLRFNTQSAIQYLRFIKDIIQTTLP